MSTTLFRRHQFQLRAASPRARAGRARRYLVSAPHKPGRPDWVVPRQDRDLPGPADPHGPVIAAGLVPELQEEVNDAYDDMRRELGRAAREFCLL